MYNFTNYTVLFLSEIKIRLFYIFMDLFITFFFLICNFNNFILFLLQPLETFNLDLNYNNVSCLLYNFLNLNYDDFIDSDNLLFFKYNNSFDLYTSLEINISNTNCLYLKLIFFFVVIIILPIITYQIYLFILPSLYKHELKTKAFLFFFYYYIFFVLKFNYLFSTILNFNYNNYQEFQNYEFDIEFIFYDYFILYLKTFFLFLLNVYLLFWYINYFINKKLFHVFYVFVNIIFYTNLFIFILFYISLFIFDYKKHIGLYEHIIKT